MMKGELKQTIANNDAALHLCLDMWDFIEPILVSGDHGLLHRLRLDIHGEVIGISRHN
jgi:hypothetical protein